MERTAGPLLKNEISMFNELSQEQLSFLYRLAPIKKLEKDQILIKEGDKGQAFYLVLDGEIRIVPNAT